MAAPGRAKDPRPAPLVFGVPSTRSPATGWTRSERAPARSSIRRRPAEPQILPRAGLPRAPRHPRRHRAHVPRLARPQQNRGNADARYRHATRKALEAARLMKEQIAQLAAGDMEFIRDTLEGEIDFDILRAPCSPVLATMRP